MLRKIVLGASLSVCAVGTPFTAQVNAGQNLGYGASQVIGIDESAATPASWAGDAPQSIVSEEIASDKWGKFKPCDCNGVCGASSSCDATNCDSLGGACCGKSGLLGLGAFPALTGLVKRSEHCYDDFISPMTNPVYFEDPRQLTEARALFINHNLPTILGNPGGRAQVYAMQVRVRLTERLSFIAVKDGYIVSQSPIMDDGWADISAGLKYSLYRDASRGQLLSAGARFEVPTGTRRALQGNGDGVMDVFLSGGTRIGNAGHYLTNSGFVIPMNSSAENQFWYWSNHLDKRIAGSKFYALTELNWYHYNKSGKAFPAAIEGGDLFNLGSVGVAGHNLVTNAYGVRYKPNGNLESGVAFEFPMSELKGVMQNRLTADLIFRF